MLPLRDASREERAAIRKAVRRLTKAARHINRLAANVERLLESRGELYESESYFAPKVSAFNRARQELTTAVAAIRARRKSS